MTTTTVTIPTREGTTLNAFLDTPDANPRSWAVFAHCFACSASSPAATRISRQLARRGFGVLRFDFAGLGDSEGDFADATFHTHRTNLQDAIAWLADNYGAPELLIGHSLGGAAALATAGSIDSLKAVVSIAAPYKPGHVTGLFANDVATIRDNGQAEVTIGGKKVTISEEFLDDICGTPQEQRLKDLPVPVLVMHSPTDELVDIHNAQSIYRAAPMPKSFIALDGADHLLTTKGAGAYAADVIAAWASRYIPEKEEADDFTHPTSGVTASLSDESAFATRMASTSHTWLLDEPTSVPGAKDLGPNPFDMMLAALAGCTSMTMRMYATRKGFELGDTKVRVDVNTTKDTTTFTRTITFAEHLDEQPRTKLLQIADKCPVHRALEAEVEILTEEG